MEAHRKTDDTRDIAISTQAMLIAHSERDEEHFKEIKDAAEKIVNKLDHLTRNQIFLTGALAAFMLLMNYPQLMKTLRPDAAEAQTTSETRIIMNGHHI